MCTLPFTKDRSENILIPHLRFFHMIKDYSVFCKWKSYKSLSYPRDARDEIHTASSQKLSTQTSKVEHINIAITQKSYLRLAL